MNIGAAEASANDSRGAPHTHPTQPIAQAQPGLAQ